jgi:hypothetical protein
MTLNCYHVQIHVVIAKPRLYNYACVFRCLVIIMSLLLSWGYTALAAGSIGHVPSP